MKIGTIIGILVASALLIFVRLVVLLGFFSFIYMNQSTN